MHWLRSRISPQCSLIAVLGLGACSGIAHPQAAESAQTLAQQGQAALAEGKYADAEAAYQKLVRMEPGIAEIHADLGLVYFQQGRFAEAVPQMQQALRLKPSLSKVATLLAFSLAEEGKYVDALPYLEKGFAQTTDPDAQRMCGLQLERAYTGLHRDSDAVEVALKMSRLYSKDPEVLYESAKIFGNYAYLTMHRLGEVAPDSSWRYQAAAEAYESQGANGAAIEQYQRVLALAPRRPGIHYRLGRTLLAKSRQDNSQAEQEEAQQEFQAELKVDPSNANAAYEIAEASRRANQLDDARKYFEMAVSAHSNFEEAHVGLAAVLLAQHHPDLAKTELQTAIQLNPDDEIAWYRLAQAERMLGNSAEQSHAIAEFKRLHQQTAPGLSPSEVTRQTLDNASQP